MPSFKKYLNDFIQPLGHPVFEIHDIFGIKLITKIYVTIDLITISTVIAPSACVALNMKHRFIFSYAVCSTLTIRYTLLSKISDIISADVTVFPDKHLHHILIYGSNVYNLVGNRLIITETITYIRKSGWFTNLEAFE